MAGMVFERCQELGKVATTDNRTAIGRRIVKVDAILCDSQHLPLRKSCNKASKVSRFQGSKKILSAAFWVRRFHVSSTEEIHFCWEPH